MNETNLEQKLADLEQRIERLERLQEAKAEYLPAREQVRDYIAHHPEHARLSSRELADLIGVSHMTVSRFRRENNEENQNG